MANEKSIVVSHAGIETAAQTMEDNLDVRKSQRHVILCSRAFSNRRCIGMQASFNFLGVAGQQLCELHSQWD